MTRRHPFTLLDLGLVAMWSSGYVGAKLAAETQSVYLVLFWRFLLVALLLAPASISHIATGGGVRAVWLNGVLGVCGMFMQIGCVVVAVGMGISAGTVSIIYATQPLLTAALAGPILGERVSPRQWIGLAIAFTGVSIASYGGQSAPLLAYLLTALGTFGLVAATLIAKVTNDATPILPSIGIQSSFCAALFMLFALADVGLRPPFHDPAFWFVVGWFIVFSTFGAFSFYWMCLRRSSTVHVGTVLYLTPVFAIAVTWLFFDEPLTVAKLCGLTICLAGAAISLSRPIAIVPPLTAGEGLVKP
ncbi:DMT family transporter [Mesorhizobium caraganae]|uniref:DMT family transporter n=1 Tax=Mesorhizobium caraganae TaxID=483206 RepID=UPI001786EC5F|nr:DMT family transporter [Mesorhizobium caraganae]